MDAIGQSVQTRACAMSDRTPPVILDLERRGTVGGIERDAAGWPTMMIGSSTNCRND
ncbi:MAG TPA: hypothetical protein VK898_09390 [Chloroflexota bacterium]|nr:hypothetical protein [Chloroflexota bacterium]